MKFILLGDATVGQEALLRFYVLHVVVLPLVLTVVVAIHFWRIRKDGGLAKPEDSKPAPNLPSGGSAGSFSSAGRCRLGSLMSILSAGSAFRGWSAVPSSRWASSKKTPSSVGPIC